MIRKQSILLGVVSILTFLSLTTTYADETQITQEDLVVDRAETNIPVNAVVESTFTVSLPSSINLVKSETGYSYASVVGVKGDIDASAVVRVAPNRAAVLFDITKRPDNDSSIPQSEEDQTYKHKAPVTMNVTQSTVVWNSEELARESSNGEYVYDVSSGFHNVSFNAAVENLKSGEWAGILDFMIGYCNGLDHNFVDGVCEYCKFARPTEPGLYSRNWTLVKSWDELQSDGTIHVNDGVLTTNFDYDTGENSSLDALVGNLVISDDVTELGAYAFSSCYELETVVISDSVTNIGDFAFIYCTNLTSISIPNSVTNIGKVAFYYTQWLADRQAEDPLVIANNILIDGTTATGDIVIPDGVSSIAGGAFANCDSLTSVSIPDSVTNIGMLAFLRCTNLDVVIIPDSVTSIGEEAFGDVPIIIYSGNATGSPWGAMYHGKYMDDNFIYADIEKTKIIAYIGTSESVVIPETVVTIGSRAFYENSNITSVTIPNSVTTIGENAFYDCTNLLSVTIPDSVKSIGKNAFYNVPLIIYSGEATGEPWGAKTMYACLEGDFAYADKNKTILIAYLGESPNVIVPDTVLVVAYTAFNKNTLIETVQLPDGLEMIDGNAFRACTSLTTINIPNSVQEIGGCAFYDTPWLESMREADPLVVVGNGILLDGITLSGDISIPSSVHSIAARAFNGCDTITSINIPDSVTNIYEEAFHHCENLTSVTIPNSITEIKEYTFYNCKSLQSIILPNSITSIGENAFESCTSLTSAILSDSITCIEDEAFRECSNLQSVNIPSGLSAINSHMFYKCTSLTEINIPDSVTSIGYYAFYGCTNLVSVSIPDSVTNIDGNAFYGTKWLNNKRAENPLVIVNNILIDARKTIGDVVIPDNVTSFSRGAFGSSDLTSVVIPDSITSIAYEAFSNCRSLTSVTIPASVTTIERYAFYWCKNLESLNYSGTKEQWANIKLCDSWGLWASIETVHCVDGDVTL